MEKDINSAVDALFGEDLTANDEREMAGLGATKAQMNRAHMQIAKKFANRKVQKAFKNSILRPEEKYLLANKDRLSPEMQKAIADKSAVLREGHYYNRRIVVPSVDKEFSLIDSNVATAPGLKNVTKEGYIDPGTSFQVERLKLSVAYHATNTNPDEQIYTNALDAETGGTTPLTIPAAILNADVEFLIGSRVIHKDSVSRFFRDSLSVASKIQGSDDSFRLKRPELVADNQTLQVRLIFPKNVTAPTGNWFLSADWFGSSIRIAGQA